MKIAKSVGILLLMVLVPPGFAQASGQADACYSCVGKTYFHPTQKDKEALLEGDIAAFCINPKTKAITLLSNGIGRGGYTLVKTSPESSHSPRFFHWVSNENARWGRYSEDLNVFVEFSDVLNQIQVVKRNKDEQPRIAYNGVCLESRRLP